MVVKMKKALSIIDCKTDVRINCYSVRESFNPDKSNYKSKYSFLALGWHIYFNRKMVLPKFDSKTGEKKVSEKSLNDSLRRARLAVCSYGMCNEFEYFGTITINSEWHDISNPIKIAEKITKSFDNYKQRKAENFSYILVGEYGEKTNRLHYHFMISGIPKDDLFVNEYHHLDWKLTREKFGHTQITRIKNTRSDRSNVAKYCTKYITKGNVKIGNHRYLCSKGLNCPKRKKIENTYFALSLCEWLEIQGFVPYYNGKYGKSFSIPARVYEDLMAYYEQIKKAIRVKPYLVKMPDWIISPFDKIQREQLSLNGV